MGGKIPENQQENLSNPDNISEIYSDERKKIRQKTEEELLKDSPGIIKLATPPKGGETRREKQECEELGKKT